MALLEPFMVKRVLSAKTLTLAPDTGKSIRVVDIMVHLPTGSGDLEAFIDQKSVAYFPEVELLNTQISYPTEDVTYPTIYRQLAEKGIDLSLPIAEGQTLTLVSSATCAVIEAVYEEYDAGDITPEMPNGTNWSEWTFVNWGQMAADSDALAWYAIDTPINPGPYPDFPFGASVPSGVEVDILGILFRTFERNEYPGAVDTYVRSKYLKLTRGTEVLHDEDLKGFYVEGDGAVAGSANVSYVYYVSELNLGRNAREETPFLFPEPIVLAAGEDLLIEVYLDGDSGGTASAGDPRTGVILRYRRV